MATHKNADEQEVEPVAWRFMLNGQWFTGSTLDVCHKVLSEAGITADIQPLYTHPAPSQEGHAAGPACSAPDEALIEEIVSRYAYSHQRSAEAAIREYIRRSAGKEQDGLSAPPD